MGGGVGCYACVCACVCKASSHDVTINLVVIQQDRIGMYENIESKQQF